MTIKIDSELELRQLESTDSVAIFETINSQRTYLRKWLPFVEITNELSDTEQFVASVVHAPEDRFEYIFTIRKKQLFIGLIGFKNTDRINNITEIGYWLSEKYQKQGIMTNAVDALCDFAFNEQGLNRIQIKCAVNNIPSITIPKRLGFKFEGIERQGELLYENVYIDLEVYSKLKNEY